MTEFVDLLAVEAWDAWFRWRERGELRDLTIDATWQRVAQALASVEGTQASTWAQRFTDAFASWQLLPDEALLRFAGTGADFTLPERPVAVLNASAFVRIGADLQAQIDHAKLQAVAGLAVRLLDNALLAAGRAGGGLRIGLVGVADCLTRLGLHYDSVRGRDAAMRMASTLAIGSLQASIALASERGGGTQDIQTRWQGRALDAETRADLTRHGARHSQLTAITPQPRLALLANRSSDALDPVAAVAHTRPGLGIEAWRDAERTPASAADGPAAQRSLRAAVQPWIDAAIDYPLLGASTKA